MERLTCPRCKNEMVPQPERLDISWAGDGPNADDVELTGLYLEVHVCAACGASAMRPAVPKLALRPATAA